MPETIQFLDAFLELTKPAYTAYTDELRKAKRVLAFAHIYDTYAATGKYAHAV